MPLPTLYGLGTCKAQRTRKELQVITDDSSAQLLERQMHFGSVAPAKCDLLEEQLRLRSSALAFTDILGGKEKFREEIKGRRRAAHACAKITHLLLKQTIEFSDELARVLDHAERQSKC